MLTSTRLRKSVLDYVSTHYPNAFVEIEILVGEMKQLSSLQGNSDREITQAILGLCQAGKLSYTTAREISLQPLA